MKENKDFLCGVFTGILMSVMFWAIISIMSWCHENSGYRNKLIIQYHSPCQEYDRKMILDLVNNSGITTNFINKTHSMSPYRTEWRMTNPDNQK